MDRTLRQSVASSTWAQSGKKTRQIEEEVGRQHQGMDKPGVGQVPEGGGEQRKMEENGCEVIGDALSTLMGNTFFPSSAEYSYLPLPSSAASVLSGFLLKTKL